MSEPAATAQRPPAHLDGGAGWPTPPPLIYLAGLAVGYALLPMLLSAVVPSAARWPVGDCVGMAGILLTGSFVYALRRARTPIVPHRAPAAQVTTGPYRFTRNPGYLGMALIYSARW